MVCVIARALASAFGLRDGTPFQFFLVPTAGRGPHHTRGPEQVRALCLPPAPPALSRGGRSGAPGVPPTSRPTCSPQTSARKRSV